MGGFGDFLQNAENKFPSNDGGQLKRALVRIFQPINASHDDVLNGGGHRGGCRLIPQSANFPLFSHKARLE